MSAAEVLTRLNVEIAAWQGLFDTLTEEEQALVAGDADRLGPLNAAKLQQLQTVSDHARNRLSDLQLAGFSPDRAGMEAWLAKLGQRELKTRWQQLGELEQQTQAINQRVGALIDLRLGATRQALNVLVHAAAGAGGGLYDTDGLAVSGLGGKPLTAA
ncbi:MAG: flagella synthesis protein FlgN [Gammaproteobacteria bacterium]